MANTSVVESTTKSLMISDWLFTDLAFKRQSSSTGLIGFRDTGIGSRGIDIEIQSIGFDRTTNQPTSEFSPLFLLPRTGNGNPVTGI